MWKKKILKHTLHRTDCQTTIVRNSEEKKKKKITIVGWLFSMHMFSYEKNKKLL